MSRAPQKLTNIATAKIISKSMVDFTFQILFPHCLILSFASKVFALDSISFVSSERVPVLGRMDS